MSYSYFFLWLSSFLFLLFCLANDLYIAYAINENYFVDKANYVRVLIVFLALLGSGYYLVEQIKFLKRK